MYEAKLSIDLKNQIFWSAVSKGNKDVLQFMVEQCGIDPETGDTNERTVLEVAAQNGNIFFLGGFLFLQRNLGQANCVSYIFQKLLESKRSICKFSMYIIVQLLLKYCPVENEKLLIYQKAIQLILQNVPGT